MSLKLVFGDLVGEGNLFTLDGDCRIFFACISSRRADRTSVTRRAHSATTCKGE